MISSVYASRMSKAVVVFVKEVWCVHVLVESEVNIDSVGEM